LMTSCGKEAKEEHDAFAEALRDKGVEVYLYGRLLAETLDLPNGRQFVLDRLCTSQPWTNARRAGPAPLRRCRRNHAGEYLVGAFSRRISNPSECTVSGGDAEGRRLHPPPPSNHLFQRTTRVGSMGSHGQPDGHARPQTRVTTHSRHLPISPLFVAEDFVNLYGMRTVTISLRPWREATSRNRQRCVLIGMASAQLPWPSRPWPHLFASGQANTVVAIELTQATLHAPGHGDVDGDKATFVLYRISTADFGAGPSPKTPRPMVSRSPAITTFGKRWPRSSR